jgi:hypothetical protein
MTSRIPVAAFLFSAAFSGAAIPSGSGKGGGSSLWIAAGLDALGAAAIGLGAWQHFNAAGYHDDWEKSGDAASRKELRKKTEDASAMSNVFYIVGGALLAAGIGVHIWF